LILLLSRHPSAPIAVTPPAGVAAELQPVSASARRHLKLAADYQQKLWCVDAIEELQRAVREEPQLRSNRELVRIAIPCLRAKTQAKTIQFLAGDVGAEARTELQLSLGENLKPDVREGVERALAVLTPAPK